MIEKIFNFLCIDYLLTSTNNTISKVKTDFISSYLDTLIKWNLAEMFTNMFKD